MIQLNDDFKDDLKVSFLKEELVVDKLRNYVEEMFNVNTQINPIDVLNLLKTSNVIGASYSDFKSNVIDLTGLKDIKCIVALLLLYIYQIDIVQFKKVCKINLRSGDMDKGMNRDRWDKYFFNVCKVVASNSKCFSRQIGAILVKDKSIISTGYNGPPRGIPTCDKRWEIDPNFKKQFSTKDTVVEKCPRHVLGFKSGEGLELCVAGHAERNALINAARQGISTIDTKMYMTCDIPCSPCLVEIINAGVEEIIVTGMTFYDELNSSYLLANSGLKVRVYSFLEK